MLHGGRASASPASSEQNRPSCLRA